MQALGVESRVERELIIQLAGVRDSLDDIKTALHGIERALLGAK